MTPPFAYRLDHVSIADHRLAALVSLLCDVLGAKYLLWGILAFRSGSGFLCLLLDDTAA